MDAFFETFWMLFDWIQSCLLSFNIKLEQFHPYAKMCLSWFNKPEKWKNTDKIQFSKGFSTLKVWKMSIQIYLYGRIVWIICEPK
jgi:hypothetical protein